MFFAGVNDFLWGDVSIAMLTLFRISTFEFWTSIMYETMEVYPLSWIYYLTFIFLTTFVFLNMMVGAVLDVMGEETKIMREEQADENDSPDEQTATAEDIKLLNDKIDKLTEMLAKKA
jgi:voltage-gated sodium channel